MAQRAWLLVAVSVVVSLAVVSGLWLGFDSGGGAAQAQTACETGGATPAGGELARDCEVLLGLKSQLAGTATLNWSADLAIASWDGVHVQSGRVTTLNLIDRGLAGTLPPSLSQLTPLVSLALNDNQLTGGIPKEWAQLRALSYLNVTGNRLTGSIPKELGSGPPLWALHLAGNQLSGSIPEELGQSATLRHLTVNGNRLTGSLPANLEGLSTLKVSGNAFTGCLPPVLRKVSSNDLGKLSIKDCATPTPTPTATATATSTPTATATATATPTPTATATPVTYALTLSAATDGSLSADPAGESHAAGTVVTVTATAADGYQLSSWGDDCAGTPATSTTCSLTMDADRTASAVFVQSPESSALPYNQLDTTGEATKPGSYAFFGGSGAQQQGEQSAEALMTPAVLTTWESLREDASRLLIHQRDASGVSHAAAYGEVTAGDYLRWELTEHCWIDYRVTNVLPDPVGEQPRKNLALEPVTFAFAACSGAIAFDSTVSGVMLEEPPVYGGASLTTPVLHGPFQLVPETWRGLTVPEQYRDTPADSSASPVYTTSLAEARKLPYWSTPTLPGGWTFGSASSGTPSDPDHGYCAVFVTSSGYAGVRICGFYLSLLHDRDQALWASGSIVQEALVLDGRPATVIYSPPGPNHDKLARVVVSIYDAATGTMYTVTGLDGSLRGDRLKGVVAIARSLFAE